MVLTQEKIGFGNAKKNKRVSPPCPVEKSVMADARHKGALDALKYKHSIG